MTVVLSLARGTIARLGLLCAALVFFAAGCGSPQLPFLPDAAPANTVAPTLPASTTRTTAPTLAPSTVPTASSHVGSEAGGDTVRLAIVPEKSEARYRVREQLFGVSFPSDAVGSTHEITGTIVGKMDGTIVSSQSKFRVDLRTLKSDRNQRDNFIRSNTLETNRYPYAEFVPIEAPGLPLTPPSSGEAQFKLVGDLTIRNVTKRVTWDVNAKMQGNEGSGQAITNFNFAYFNLTQPRVPTVLSVEDNIRLELDFTLQRAS